MDLGKSVYVEGNCSLTEGMFLDNGWVVSSKPQGVDLICFTGGEDVSPMLYEAVALEETYANPKRDQDCSDLFHKTKDKVAMCGICRGAQFLNVMMGGELYQDVNNHGGAHDAYNPDTGVVINVSSTHHQMMIPSEEGEVVLVAHEATERKPVKVHYNEEPDADIEAVFYEEDGVFCYQPHPEYHSLGHQCQTFFFEYVNKLVGDK